MSVTIIFSTFDSLPYRDAGNYCTRQGSSHSVWHVEGAGCPMYGMSNQPEAFTYIDIVFIGYLVSEGTRILGRCERHAVT